MAAQRAKEALAYMRINAEKNTEASLLVASHWALVFLAENKATEVGWQMRERFEQEELVG